MADNPFEQFASRQDIGNPFTRFSEPVQAQPVVKEAPSTLRDMFDAARAGAVRGAIGLATLPSTIGTLAEEGIYKLGGAVGLDTDAMRKTVTDARQQAGRNPLPSYQGVKQAVEDNVTGKLYEPQTVPGKYANTVGEFATGALFPGGGIAQKVLGNVVAPAVASETAGQMTEGTSAEPWARMGGALAGGMLPNAVARAYTPAPATAERTRHVNTLRNEGVADLTAGQVTGSQPLRWLESATIDTPLTGTRAPQMMERQAEQFTRAALRRAGIDAPRATDQVLDQGFTRLGNEFDRLAMSSSARMTRPDYSGLEAAVRRYEMMTPPSARVPAVREILDDLRPHVGQVMPGEVYQRYRSIIEGVARSTHSADPVAADAIRSMRNILDSSVERGLPGAMQGQWRDVRNQYRNMLVIEKAATSAGENAAMGLISPSALRNATINVQGRRNYARGDGDFAEMSRAGEAIMKPLPQSGTAPRQMAMQVGQAVAGAGAGGLVGGNAEGAGVGALAPFVLKGMLGRTMMSRPMQAYLANQAIPQSVVNANRSSIASSPAALMTLMNMHRGGGGLLSDLEQR